MVNFQNQKNLKKLNLIKTCLFIILLGMLSAAASLGLIHLWDVHGGLTPIDKYLYTSEEYIKVSIKFVYFIKKYVLY